jgi:small ligand-binding sensory domain FIST
LRASRRFVFTRSPGFRGINAGAITAHVRFGEHSHQPRASRASLRTKRRTAPGSLASCHATGVVAAPINIATERSFFVRIDSDVRRNLFHDRLLSVRAGAARR